MGGTAAGRRGIGQVPPRGVPQDNTTSTRKVANQAEMGTSFQGSYIQTLHDQQGRGGPDGTRHWHVAGGWANQEQYWKTKPPPHSHPIPTPPLVTKALQGVPGGQEFPVGVPRERGSPVQPCSGTEMGHAIPALVGHVGNNELKECCPPLTPPSAQSEGMLPGS